MGAGFSEGYARLFGRRRWLPVPHSPALPELSLTFGLVLVWTCFAIGQTL